jgi:ADP-heptose:LPS heptosyltransferase
MPVLRSDKYRDILRKRKERLRPDKIVRTMSLKEFYEKRDKILMIRSVGGLGDIIMHRMIFEDIKLLMPDAEIHFACPQQYHDVVKDHPLIEKVLTIEEIDKSKYILSYNTTTACGRTEMRLAPYSGPHRSDIWANHCGIDLTRHNMHFQLTQKEKEEGKRLIENARDKDGPTVLVSPISAMVNKNLLDSQVLGLVKGLRSRGLCPFGIHNHPLMVMAKNDIPYISDLNLRQWLAVIDQSDYVVSVDTSTFHAAGGMKKPLVGIFTFVDGHVYGKYFDFFLVQKHRDDDPNWTCGPCYNWGTCPKTDNDPKPCLTEITVDMILDKVDLMLEKWPMQDSI